jgi:cytochrome c553
MEARHVIRRLLFAGVLGGVAVGVAAQGPKPDPARAARMKVHYAQVLVVHDAVIRGDLPAAAAPAKALAQDPPAAQMNVHLAPYDAALRKAAARIGTTTDPRGAAITTATMLAACGDCHRASGKAPVLPPLDGGPSGGIVAHMLAHQRAADDLLQGLVGPSGSRWREGAVALKQAALKSDKLPRDHKLTPEIVEAEQRVHMLADTMAAADTQEKRVAAYGELIQTCARCHSLHQTVWGPGRK